MPGTDPVRPRAILFDLDDTLIDVYRDPAAAWRAVIAEVLPDLDANATAALSDAVMAAVRGFLDHPARRQAWRLDPRGARPAVIAQALAPFTDPQARERTARALALGYETHRRDTMALPQASADLLAALCARDIALGLITNGRSDVQRHKIEHFGLSEFFGHIQIEEEAGYGKPDPQAFRDCLDALGVAPGEAWMIGDDLYYDVLPANRLGLWTFWCDSGIRRPHAREPSARHRRISTPSALLDFLN